MSFALIFDVDGVIADTEALSTRAASQAFRDLYGLDLTPKDHEPFVGATAPKHAAGIAANNGIEIDVDAVVAGHVRNFLEGLESCEHVIFPGVAYLIETVYALPEWRIGLATSSSRERSHATIEATALDSTRFEAWLTGDNVERSKPDPEIYQRAAMALGTPTNQCVVIEDSVAGVTAAKSAGMACIAVTNTFPGEALRLADRIVDSLETVDTTMLYDLVHEAGSDSP